MKVIHVAYECAPIYKKGGLGDVVGALPKFQKSLGIDVQIVMPRYTFIKQLKTLPHTDIPIQYITSKLFNEDIFTRGPQISAHAFAYFAIAVLADFKMCHFQPDIIHIHDWHGSLIPLILHKTSDDFFSHTKTIITIHNAAFQGNFPLAYLKQPETQSLLDMITPQKGKVSFLKEGLRYADRITTVSPQYAHEITHTKFGFGLQTLLQKRGVTGIINGIDTDVWNPVTDPFLSTTYSLKTISKDKKVNKLALQKRLGLEINSNIPLFGMVSRLSQQKGVDLLVPLLSKLKDKKMQLVILGKGSQAIELSLKKFQKKQNKAWFSLNLAFDEQLAHQIYAGSDFFLIPSHFEPCGLTQMISMRYGTIPIVSPVGGLVDTVRDRNTGIVIKKVTSASLWQSIVEAERIWYDSSALNQMMVNVMHEDFSWHKSAQAYIDLYHSMLKY